MEVNFGAGVDVGRIFYGTLQALGSHQPSIWEEGEAFYDMRIKIVRRLPSWQRFGVVSQQRLRLRCLTLVNRLPKLRLEPVSFLFLLVFLFVLTAKRRNDGCGIRMKSYILQRRPNPR